MDEEPNYTETTEDHTGSGYSIRTRTNMARPKDGSQPLTIIEFSLTNEVQKKLEDALRPYVEGRENNLAALGKIFSNPEYFPAPVLEELKNLNQEGENPSTVYVVKNLPELSSAQMRELSTHKRMTNSYAHFIGLGVGQATGMKHTRTGYLARVQGREIDGKELHKHPDPVNAISGLYLANPDIDAPATQYTDVGALLNDPEFQDVNSRNVTLHQHPFSTPGSIIRNDSTMRSVIPEWEYPQEIELRIKGNDPKLKQLIARHSQEVTAMPGDLVLWSNHGKIFHQALPAKETPYEQNEVSRAILTHHFQKARKHLGSD